MSKPKKYPKTDKAEQEQVISKKSRSLDIRLHLLGYVVASIFLYIEGDKLSDVPIQAIGISILVAAFLILLGQLRVAILIKIAKFVDDVFRLPMYMIAIAVFIKGIVEWVNFTKQSAWLWVIPVALLAFIVYDLIEIAKDTRAMTRSIGKKATVIRQLKILSFVLTLFVLVILAFDVQGIGKPFIWLTPGVVSLVIALSLEGTFKK